MYFYFRHFNEMTKQHDLSGGSSSSNQGQGPSGSSGQGHIRPRTVSSPIPYVSPNSSRPLSPGKAPLKISVFRVTGLNILGSVSTHIFLSIFFWKKKFIHFERHFAFQNAKNHIFFQKT